LRLPWLLVAVAYRQAWPDRLKAALPQGWSWLHHAFRGLLFVPTFLTHTFLPGNLGEEVGWRGYLVRRWAGRPLVAAAITIPVWAGFHLPVIFSSAQKGHPALNAIFLLSIAAAAAPFAAFYLWGRSVWPCAVLHFSWYMWNPLLLGDVLLRLREVALQFLHALFGIPQAHRELIVLLPQQRSGNTAISLARLRYVGIGTRAVECFADTLPARLQFALARVQQVEADPAEQT